MLARIKVGDSVEVISGKDKGKRGQIIEISKDKSKVKVRGLFLAYNFEKKKVTPQGSSEGGMKQLERFIHACKVMPICPETDKRCRVRSKITSLGQKVRVSHISGEKI